jgi:hypothetical protein
MGKSNTLLATAAAAAISYGAYLVSTIDPNAKDGKTHIFLADGGMGGEGETTTMPEGSGGGSGGEPADTDTDTDTDTADTDTDSDTDDGCDTLDDDPSTGVAWGSVNTNDKIYTNETPAGVPAVGNNVILGQAVTGVDVIAVNNTGNCTRRMGQIRTTSRIGGVSAVGTYPTCPYELTTDIDTSTIEGCACPNCASTMSMNSLSPVLLDWDAGNSYWIYDDDVNGHTLGQEQYYYLGQIKIEWSGSTDWTLTVSCTDLMSSYSIIWVGYKHYGNDPRGHYAGGSVDCGCGYATGVIVQ